jgi:hypothetical protein
MTVRTETFDPTTLRRLAELQGRLDQAESRLRSLAGKLRNRTSPADAPLPSQAPDPGPLESELQEQLASDLRPPPRAAITELENRLRKQALAHFQKTKVDPQLWKDLASS